MTISVDFDVPIHLYSRGWHDGTLYDQPTPGALEALAYLMARDSVFIHTTRIPGQVTAWLAEHTDFTVTTDDRCRTCTVQLSPPTRPPRAACPDCQGTGRLLFWDIRDVLLVTNRKLPAYVYVDDRAVRFTPEAGWPAAVEAAAEFVPALREGRQEP